MTDTKPVIDLPPALKRGSALALMIAAIIAALYASGQFTPAGDMVATPAVTGTATERPTPTMIAGNPTTTGIIEVTPLGGGPTPFPTLTPTPNWGYPLSFLEAWYTPKYAMNVRNAASVTAPIVGSLEINKTVRIWAIVYLANGDSWLCLDYQTNALATPTGSDCQRAVAYRIGSVVFGELEIVRP